MNKRSRDRSTRSSVTVSYTGTKGDTFIGGKRVRFSRHNQLIPVVPMVSVARTVPNVSPSSLASSTNHSCPPLIANHTPLIPSLIRIIMDYLASRYMALVCGRHKFQYQDIDAGADSYHWFIPTGSDGARVTCDTVK